MGYLGHRTLVAIWTLLLLSSCLKSTRQSKEMQLRVPLSMDARSLDPAVASDSSSSEVIPSIFETLFQYAYLSDTHRIEPLLATDLPHYSNNRRTLTISIRKGVYFHDDAAFAAHDGKGRELRAHDFIYGIKRLFLPSVQSHAASLFRGKIQGLDSFHNKLVNTSKKNLPIVFTEPVEGLKAIDDHTLRIKLTRPFPQILHLLSQSFTAPIPREAIDLYADENWNNHFHPIGTGPFFLYRWDRGKEIILRRNTKYHTDAYPVRGDQRFKDLGYLQDSGKALPFAHQLSFVVNRDQIMSEIEFSKGLLDLTPSIHPSKRPRINTVHLSDPSDSIFFLAFNMRDSLLGKKKRIRQAISSAIDRRAYVELFTQGTGKVAHSFLPEGLHGRPTSSFPFTYNLKRARQLMKAAGYPQGKKLPPITLDLRGTDELNRRVGQFLTRSLQKIGIQLIVVLNNFPDFLEKVRDGKTQMYLDGWTLDYPDAENIYQLLFGKNHPPGANTTRFSHKEFDRLYKSMSTMEVGEQRDHLIKKMEKIVSQELPWVPIYYPANTAWIHPWLKNYRPSSIIRNRYKYLKADLSQKSKYKSQSSL